MDIGSRVRAARKAANLSQEGLARRADVSLNVVSRLERGEIGDPHSSTLGRLAHALGVSVGDLLEGPAAPKAPAPSPSPEGGGATPEEPGLTAEAQRHIEAMGAATYYPVASSTIALVSGVCDGVEYRVEQEDYSLKAALQDRVEVLETLGHCRTLQRNVFKKDHAATPHQREALDPLEDRLKAVRKKVTAAYERLWNAEPDPEKVISLDDQRKIQELEQSVGAA